MKPADERSKPQAQRPPGRIRGDVEHVVDTALPPGIDEQDAKDPGAKTRDQPVENRS